MTALVPGLRKWTTVFSVFLQDGLAYRGQAVIWMMTNTVPAVIMPIVWLASYGGRSQIGGFSPSQMVSYYLVTLCLSNVMITHVMWDMAMEIREGRFSVFLTRPFSYMAYQFAGNLSWRLMRGALFVPIFLVCAAIFRPYLRWEGYHLGWTFWAAVLGGHLLSFCVSYTMGLLALFFVEVRSIYMFYYMPFTFLSGELVPLALLPKWATALAQMLPFRYTLAFPVEIFMNRLSPGEMGYGFVMLAGWLIVMFLASRVLWKKGLRHYTGVGM